MKPLYTFCLLFVFAGCNNQYLELEKNPLKGEIDGKEWVFGSGWVTYDPIYSQGLKGILFEQDLNDPCSKVQIIEPHISLSIPYARGNYNLPFPEPNYFVDFSVDGVKEYTASSGFIEIVAVTSTEVVGFLSADFDDENNAQGSFSLRLCD